MPSLFGVHLWGKRDGCQHWWEWHKERYQGAQVIRFPNSTKFIERHVDVRYCVLCDVRMAWAARVPRGATLVDGTPVRDKSYQ